MYDYDVVVVGAGPAGLAAATRVRWVKGYHALAGSVCLIESGKPGGLLRWGSCVMTGPGWAYGGEDLAQRLLSDVERLQIPILADRVSRIEREGRLLRTSLRGGRTLRSHAVILATGFRPLANESEYYLRGVRITFKGYEHFPSLVRACVRDADGRGLVVIGNRKTAHLAALLRPIPECRVVDRAELVEVVGLDRVEGVRLRGADGEVETAPCGAVLMDYNGFELSPTFDVRGLDIARDERGFVIADSWMRTSEPGVFAAGDITGRYASTLMALGDGVCAGFSAYAHAFEAKLGRAPALFAYAATDAPLPAEPRDLPPLPPDAIPVGLGDAASIPDWVDGRATLAEAAGRLGTTVAALAEALGPAIAEKAVTVHAIRLAGDPTS